MLSSMEPGVPTKGGMDGVEILAAFGFLPQAFLSPLTNFREDAYGGSLENRLRFLLELLQAVRKAIGPSRILGLRIPGDEFEPGGLTLDDMKIVASKIAETGLVDYLNVIAHTNISHTGRAKHWAPTPAEHGIFVPLATAIRSVVSIPVFTAGRITDPFHAERIISNKQADMVAMTRANICDPQLVAKIISNQIKQIRPCVGANTCIANRYVGKPINCMHNAAVSKPDISFETAERAKSITVIGGGPSGLEAARVAAERGHKVEVFEQSTRLGGQLSLWASAPSMGELESIIRWRISELERLGVVVHLNHKSQPDDFDQLDSDELVIATGSNDFVRLIAGTHAIPVITPHSLLRGEPFQASKALVVNEGRGQAGFAAAELLIHKGVEVEIITSDIAVGNDIDPTNRSAWYMRLGERGCVFTATQTISYAEDNQVICQNVYDMRTSQRNNIDLIVNWQGCQVDNTFSEVSFKSRENIHFIGDCVSPRNVEIAMGEAEALANRL